MNAGPILGVDIGSHGALALLSDDGNLIDVAAKSLLRDGSHSRLAAKGTRLAATMHCSGPERALVGRAQASLIAIEDLVRDGRASP